MTTIPTRTIVRLRPPGGVPGPSFARQEHEPVYLTNHCGENAHGDPALLERFGLAYGSWAGGFHPLTPAEAARNAEDSVETRYGTFLTGYTVLFAGRKWYGPVLERAFQAPVNGHDPGLPTEVACLRSIDQQAEEMAPALAALGGRVVVGSDPCRGDRHTLQILLRTDMVERWCVDHEAFCALLTALVGGPRTPMPPLRATPGEFGDYFVLDLLTPDGSGHVASVTAWDHHATIGPASAAHARQLMAAGEMYVACCALLRGYLGLHGRLYPEEPPAGGPPLAHAVATLARARSAAVPGGA